ncbi:MAG: ABC transporter, permease protein 2 (cluster 1, maltose/g3p/polyamine/iron) [uncultured Thermomicrobiales bacterium]|uniref:ABC transporter, permease protein 2 (Cluster 1, maltose/g3p/polyamine/iron) n=1 Tax=uncultured Thermomicrobiales bacterium TaxID=1645740 RepID=A0A6J4UHR2_9BACT|nr:MAG: ABC transporter, permease protein 2 (cluster 1, maltose/g3p/polyamine/iron) [uncultured Thermomicrobiales bacterium]
MRSPFRRGTLGIVASAPVSRTAAGSSTGSSAGSGFGLSLARFAGYAAILLLVVAVATPLLWMVTGAFKTSREIRTLPTVWWPSALQWNSFGDIRASIVNFTEAWQAAPFGRFYINSLIITIGGMILELVNAVLTAYALAFLRFPRKNLIFVLILAALMVPSQVTIIPTYVLLGRTFPDVFGIPSWINTYQGMIVPGAATAFGTFLLRQAFLGLPRDVFDAAKVDGCGHLRLLWDIVIPMAKPVMVTFALISMVAKWNDYLWPLIITNETAMRPLTVGITYLFDAEGNTNYGVVMAATIFVIAPLLAVFIWAQRYIIEGMTAGATKG